MSFGCASPKPHPPSRVCAITGPAHLPLLKPQHADAQSESLVQGPVMNCAPLPLPEPEPEVEEEEEAEALVSAVPALDVPLLVEPPVKATAALSLGVLSPKPQPPSRSWATTAPAHFPLLKPQQPDAQSASLVHAPVMNCVPVPWETTRAARLKRMKLSLRALRRAIVVVGFPVVFVDVYCKWFVCLYKEWRWKSRLCPAQDELKLKGKDGCLQWM